MCGIAAILPINNTCINTRTIKSMSNLLKHRGPDDEGFSFFVEDKNKWKTIHYKGSSEPNNNDPILFPERECIPENEIISSSLSFCHRRLSILDLSSHGHQPMSYRNRYWIIFNGEIYNFVELRIELEKKGHNFTSFTDTEVILASYAEWGYDCLHKFIGMWAFLIFDTKTSIHFGSRDRFGIKPLYYWYSSKGFIAFASEIKGFTQLPGWSPVVNGKRAYDFLIHALSDHTHETMFDGVFQIRGGEFFAFDIKQPIEKIIVNKWYHLPDNKNSDSYETGYEKYKNLLSESVKIHLRSDVPVGSCLSGGLDSSSIVCLIHNMLSATGDESKQKTFSAGSLQKQWDEMPYIKETVNSHNIEPHYIYPELNQLLTDLPKIIWHQDEPFTSTSIFAQWCVFKLAKEQNVTVLLDGQGSDEYIAGYPDFLNIYIAELFHRLSLKRLIHELCCIENLYGRIYGYSKTEIMKNSLSFLLKRNRLGKKILLNLQSETFAPPWLDISRLHVNPNIPIFEKNQGEDLVTSHCYEQTFFSHLPFLLHYEDRNSMAYSRESRVPFLDHRLVEYVLTLPPNHKIRNGTSKMILRGAMKNIIPEKVRIRTDKLGFATPEEFWIKTEAPEKFRNLLQHAVTCSSGILTNEALQYYDKVIAGEAPFTFTIWRMIIFGTWMEQFHVASST